MLTTGKVATVWGPHHVMCRPCIVVLSTCNEFPYDVLERGTMGFFNIKISLVVNERRLDKMAGKKDAADGRKTKVSFYWVKEKSLSMIRSA